MWELGRRFAVVAMLLGISLMAADESHASVVTDPVEDNDGWVVTGNEIHFVSACCGTSPTAGTTYLHIQNSGVLVGGRIASKSFPGNTLVVGSYTVTFDIGDFNNRPFAEIDLSQTGLTVNGAVLTPVSSSTSTPASGNIETWTLTYQVLPGDPDLGQTLGFRLVAPDSGLDHNASFDNLTITSSIAVPTIDKWGLIVMGLILLCTLTVVTGRLISIDGSVRTPRV